MAAKTVFTGKSIRQLWVQGWNEIPEVMGSSIFAIIGFVGIPIYLHHWEKNDLGNHRYKHRYLVYRPEDPRVERIKKFEDSPPTTRVYSYTPTPC